MGGQEVNIIDREGEFVNVTDNALDINNDVLNEAQDPMSKNIGTIDIEHKKIHDGTHFFNSKYITATNAETVNWVLETGAKTAHMTFAIDSADAGFSFITYENIVANEDGTLQTLLNNNRNSATTSTLKMRLRATGTDITGSQEVRSGWYGTAGGTSQRQGGNLTRGAELLLKPNTKYLLRITNLSTTNNRINILHSWYEV